MIRRIVYNCFVSISELLQGYTTMMRELQEAVYTLGQFTYARKANIGFVLSTK